MREILTYAITGVITLAATLWWGAAFVGLIDVTRKATREEGTVPGPLILAWAFLVVCIALGLQRGCAR
jgi:hypothetical protein